MLAVLVQIDGFDPVTGQAVSLYAASHDDPTLCHLDGRVWWPALAKLPTLRYDFFDGAFAGQITAPSSSLSMTTEPWPEFGHYILADARLRLWTGELGAAWSTYVLRVDGRVTSQPETDAGRASVDFAVDDRWLDAALLATYAGTSGGEGGEDLKGQAKPLALGAPRYIAGKLVDAVNSVFQLSGHGPIQAVDTAMEKLARFGPATANYGTLDALVAATLPAGAWATCLSGGFVRFGAPPVGQVSFLMRGDTVGGWARKPGEIIRRLAQLSGGEGRVDAASLVTLDAARPYNLSLYLDAQTTAREMIQRIAASVNAVALVSWTGALMVLPVAVGVPTATLAADGSALPPVASVKQVEMAAPWRKLAIGAERAWTVHALGDIAFTAPLIDRGAYAAATIYREGNIVSLPDGSRWLYIATTAASGQSPPDPAFWSALADGPVVDFKTQVAGAEKPADNATNSADPNSPFGPDDTIGGAKGKVQNARDRIQAVEDAIRDTDLGNSGAANAAATAAKHSEDNAAASATTATNRAGDAAGSASTAAGKAQEATEQASAAATSARTAAAFNRSRPNLVTNGSGENGMAGIGGDVANWSAVGGPWGTVFVCTTLSADTGRLTWPAFDVEPGATYTIAADALLSASTGSAYVDILFLKADGTLAPGGDGPQRPRSRTFDFSADGSGQDAIAVSAVCPAGAAKGVARFVWNTVSTLTVMGVRQLKVERGELPWTPYNQSTADLYRAVSANVDQTTRVGVDADAALAAYGRQVNAAFDGLTETGLSRTIATKASFSEVDTAIATERGARVASENSIRADADGKFATVTQFAGVQALVGDRTSAYFKIAAVTSGGVAQLDLVSDSQTGTIFQIRAGTIIFSADDVLIDDSTGTRKLRPNSVTDGDAFANNNVVVGQGAGNVYPGGYDNVPFQDIANLSPVVAYAGRFRVSCSLKQDFSNGARAWVVELLINGVVVDSAYGTAIQDKVPLTGAADVADGPVLIQVRVAGQDGTYSARNPRGDWEVRYR